MVKGIEHLHKIGKKIHQPVLTNGTFITTSLTKNIHDTPNGKVVETDQEKYSPRHIQV